MKNYRRRLSIILTLVLIITSLGFTGAFADPVAGTPDQIEQEAAADTAQSPSAETGEQAAAPASGNDQAAPAGETVPADNAGTADQADPAGTGDQTAPADETVPAGDAVTTGAEDPAADPDAPKKPVVKWVMDDGITVIKETEVESGTVPVFDGEEPVKAEDDDYVYTFSGWDPEPAAVTEDTTYKAVFTKKSKRGIPEKPEVKTFSSFKSVALEWEAVTKDVNGDEYTDEAKEQIGYRVRYKKGNGAWKSWSDVGTKLKYHTPKPYKLDPLSTYHFEVEAYSVSADGTKNYSEADASKDSPVKPMRYKLYIKEGGTLTSHYKYNASKDSYKASGAGKKYVSAGDVIYADRFATGKYMFTEGKYVYYVSRTRVGKKSCVYTTKWNYKPKEIEYFANDKGLKSKTKYLIITSTYTQHVYVLKGKRSGRRYKNWENFTVASKRSRNKYAYEKDLKKGAVMNWECGTGTASDPTPTSHTGLKETTRWVKVRHSIPWWTKFHGTASFHGNKIRTNNKGLGKPVSSGCIRNPHERAHWIWDLCKKGTQVYIY